MRQQAVELALKVDPSLARELARQSNDKDEQKRLWLMIARNSADNSSSRHGKDVVARVVSVLKDCGRDVLSIEDVLPFLYGSFVFIFRLLFVRNVFNSNNTFSVISRKT